MEKERFVSYAQDLEDLILWNVLKDEEKGFYVDVGANDPVHLSVTKSFYDAGWNGINIEPLEEEYNKLCADRVRDINLCIGAGNKEGEMSLIVLGVLSTFNEKEKLIIKERIKDVVERKVPVMTCKKIFEIYENNIENIQFFKIDVEGNEKEVLEGIDFDKVRPWIFVVESTQPGTMISTAENFEGILLNNGYDYCFQHGINRYYVDREKRYLKKKFLPIEELLEIYDVFCVKRYADFGKRSLKKKIFERLIRILN